MRSTNGFQPKTFLAKRKRKTHETNWGTLDLWIASFVCEQERTRTKLSKKKKKLFLMHNCNKSLSQFIFVSKGDQFFVVFFLFFLFSVFAVSKFIHFSSWRILESETGKRRSNEKSLQPCVWWQPRALSVRITSLKLSGALNCIKTKYRGWARLKCAKCEEFSCALR